MRKYSISTYAFGFISLCFAAVIAFVGWVCVWSLNNGIYLLSAMMAVLFLDFVLDMFRKSAVNFHRHLELDRWNYAKEQEGRRKNMLNEYDFSQGVRGKYDREGDE